MSRPEDRIPAPMARDITRIDERMPSNIGLREFLVQFLPESVSNIILNPNSTPVNTTTPYKLPANTTKWELMRDREKQKQMEAERNKRITEELESIRSGTHNIRAREPSLIESFVPLPIREAFRPSTTTRESLAGEFVSNMVGDFIRNPLSTIEGGGGLAGISPYVHKLRLNPENYGINVREIFRYNRNSQLPVNRFIEDLDEFAENFSEVVPKNRYSRRSLEKLYESGVNIDDLEKASKLGERIGTWTIEGGVLEHTMKDGRLMTIETFGPKFKVKVLPVSSKGIIPGGKTHEYIAENPYDLYNRIRDIVIKPPIITDLPRRRR